MLFLLLSLSGFLCEPTSAPWSSKSPDFNICGMIWIDALTSAANSARTTAGSWARMEENSARSYSVKKFNLLQIVNIILNTEKSITLHWNLALWLFRFFFNYKLKIYKNFVSTIMPLSKSATTTHFLVIVVIVTDALKPSMNFASNHFDLERTWRRLFQKHAYVVHTKFGITCLNVPQQCRQVTINHDYRLRLPHSCFYEKQYFYDLPTLLGDIQTSDTKFSVYNIRMFLE
jgi:hypothetical protein